jgi:hypothetical protein
MNVKCYLKTVPLEPKKGEEVHTHTHTHIFMIFWKRASLAQIFHFEKQD